MKRVVIWGAAGHARVVADAIRQRGELHVEGFIDDVTPARRTEAFCGATVLGGRDQIELLKSRGVTLIALAFGHNAARLRLGRELSALGFELPPIVHPQAVIAPDVRVGAGCFVGPGAVLGPAARIGALAIVNSAVVVEHDCEVGEGVHLSPRVCLGGGAHVGHTTWVGLGALVRDHVTVGSESMIGMGAVVVSDLPNRVVAYGCPARVIERMTQ